MATKHDDDALKGFLGWFYDHVLDPDGRHRAEVHPLAVLAGIERTSRRDARRGLVMAIEDCIDMSADLGPETIRAADAELAGKGLPLLSELRLQHSRRLRSILKRGRIRNESEFHLIKNAADSLPPEEEQKRLWALLGEFEFSGRRQARPETL